MAEWLKHFCPHWKTLLFNPQPLVPSRFPCAKAPVLELWSSWRKDGVDCCTIGVETTSNNRKSNLLLLVKINIT